MPHYIEPTNVKVNSVNHLTHDVLSIEAEKPAGINYKPGQAVDVSINKDGWAEEVRPFTFVSLQEDDHIEFNIKTYPDHHGVTEQFLGLKPNDELLIGEVFGDIQYKEPGIFIAGGAGITPFIAIFKQLEKEGRVGNNKLIFANKTQSDIIQKDFFDKLLGKNFINILSAEKVDGFEHGYVSPELIKKHSEGHLKYYYLCGPDPMMDAVVRHLEGLGVKSDQIIREGF